MDQVMWLLFSSVVLVTLLRKIKLPPVLGYLGIGALLGPHALGVVAESPALALLAEMGVVFLLFDIGLEMHLPQFLAMRKVLLKLGFWQVIGTTLLGMGVLWLYEVPLLTAGVAAGALSLSSTAIVIKQLKDQQEFTEKVGSLSFGLLIFQDLAAIPLLIMIPVLSQSAAWWVLAGELGWVVIKGFLALTLLSFLGRKMLGAFFTFVAKAKSPEVFTLAVLLVATTAATVTHFLGLSMAMGAFLAGLILGDSKFHHQVASDIRPFRDILLGLFFVSVGTQLDFGTLSQAYPAVLWGLVVLLSLKGAWIAWVGKRFGLAMSWRAACRLGLVMSHAGEFGILLLALAMKHGIVSETLGQILLAISILSMFLAVFMVRYNRAWVDLCLPAASRAQDRASEPEVEAVLEVGHVIVCGFGRVGQIIARFLKKSQIPYVALDLASDQVQEARLAGEPVYYGSAANPDTLRSLGVSDARLMVVCVDDVPESERILSAVRQIAPQLPVMVRTRDDSGLERLTAAGATEVVPEVLEAGLMLVSHALLMLGYSPDKVIKLIADAKYGRYRLLKGFFEHTKQVFVGEEGDRECRHVVRLCAGAYAIGKTLAEAQSQVANVVLESVCREQQKPLEPHPDLVLEENDGLLCRGLPEELDDVERVLLEGWA